MALFKKHGWVWETDKEGRVIRTVKKGREFKPKAAKQRHVDYTTANTATKQNEDFTRYTNGTFSNGWASR